MAILAVVPAAGIGSRMQSSLPKQYLPLHGDTVLAHSLRRLTALPRIKSLMVALAPDDVWWPQVRAQVADPRIAICSGGDDRWLSVLNALDALTTQADAANDDWVLVHDAVRPCVRSDDIQRLLEAVTGSSAVGGLLAMPVSDTIKRAATDSTAVGPLVEATVDRQHLWAACTPQVFRLGALRDALRRAADTGAVLTDEASAMEWCGYQPLLVACARDNIKITYRDDLALAEAMLAAQARQQAEPPST